MHCSDIPLESRDAAKWSTSVGIARHTQKNIRGSSILTSSGSGSSSSSTSSSTGSSEASGVSSAFGSSAGASAYTVEKREDTNEVKLMVAFGRVAIGQRPVTLFARAGLRHAT